VRRTARRTLIPLIAAILLIMGGTASAQVQPTRNLVNLEQSTALSAPSVTVTPVAATVNTTFPGRVVDIKTHQLVQRTILTNRGTSAARDILLRIPIMARSTSHYQTIVSETISPQPERIETDERGNRVAVFQFSQLRAGQRLVIEETYIIKHGGYSLNGQGNTASLVSTTLEETSTYLQTEPKIEADNERIRARARELTAGLDTDMDRARAIFDFVISHMDYNSKSPHRNQGALAGFTYGEGVCEEYASLFVAMSRAVGVPARIVNGFSRDDKRGNRLVSGNDGTLSLRGLRHQWAEFYVEGSGWIPVEPTFSGRKGGSYYRFGNLPTANHIVQNYGDKSLTGRYIGGKVLIITEQILKAN